MSDRMEIFDRIHSIKMTIIGLESKYGEDSIQDNQIFAEVQLYKEELAYLKNQLKVLDLPEGNSASEVPPIVWLATARDFASMIIEMWEKEYIKAESKTDALKIASLHFEGVSHDPHSLYQSYKAQMDDGKGGKFADLPPATPQKTTKG
ncbi:MAG: hypothetical protein ABSC60_01690 [Acidobacteriota bacterium]